MTVMRSLCWPDDRSLLQALDTSFTTACVYRLQQTGKAFTLQEAALDSPLQKAYPFAEQVEQLPYADWVQVATDSGRVIGIIVLRFDDWNRRAVVEHLYVAPESRRKRVGRALIDAAVEESRRRGARCLWVETQNTNFPAIQFYERLGFVCCGFDSSLYDSDQSASLEVAVYFVRTLH